MLAAPPAEPTIPRRGIIWSIIATVILVGGLIAALIALRRAENWAARHRQIPAPSVQGGQ